MSAAEPLQPAHCRRTAGALPALAPHGPQSQSTAPRAPHARSRMARQGGTASDEESCERTTRCPTSRGARREGGRAVGGGNGDARASSGSRQCHARCPRPAQLPWQRLAIVSWLELVLRPRTLCPRRQLPPHGGWASSARRWAARAGGDVEVPAAAAAAVAQSLCGGGARKRSAAVGSPWTVSVVTSVCDRTC